MKNNSTPHRICVFLSVPGKMDEQSKVFIQFYSSNELKGLPDAVDYLKTKSPVPLLLHIRRKEVNACVEIESLNMPKITFGFSPPSGNPEQDLNEILSWFQQNNIDAKLAS